MQLNELKNKALSLPLAPGVYIMKDKGDKVIYIGKAKKLKNRVSQYFQDTASHNPKTRMMVSKIDHFEVIVAASEFEALVLECSLIKRHRPKYNILLKDDKGYPYVRLNMKEAYPSVKMVNKPVNDGAQYYGPFGSRRDTSALLKAIQIAFKLPDCNRVFPRDVGKGRPCLNFHMNTCAGWCQELHSQEEYRAVMEQVRQLLQGNYKIVADKIRCQMHQAAESLQFELATGLRDRLNAVENLGKKQLVTAGSKADTDVIGFAQTETKACFTVLHYRNGNLLEKDDMLLSASQDADADRSSLVKQYYWERGFVPGVILLPTTMEDQESFAELLSDQCNKSIKIKVPQRGDKAHLIALAQRNAQEEAERATNKEERLTATLTMLGNLLSTPVPKRIEAFDVSNISGTDIVASMVVFDKGKPKRSEYKRFRIEGLTEQNDYASMAQTIRRRFTRYLQNDAGFNTKPDLVLIDGGIAHAKTALDVLIELNLSFPVYGMVKDDKHRTRALVTPDGLQINIDTKQSVFSLIGNIQEETHRFAINYHRKLRNNRLKHSELDKIPGIGPKRKQDLLKQFKSLSGIATANITELERILPRNTAIAVYNHFNKKTEG